MTSSLVENVILSIDLIQDKDDEDLITNRIFVFNKVILEGLQLLHELENKQNEKSMEKIV